MAIRKVGQKGLEFGTADEILAAHPGDKCWDSPRGEIGDAVILTDGVECISIFIGCGAAVLISAEGRYIRDDVGAVLERVVGGAWLPRSTYKKAEERLLRG